MPSEADIERLLGALRGVRSARAIMASDGRVVELHILSTPEFHPKQVVRNVESALSAVYRLEVDRRTISVSQLAEDAEPADAKSPDPVPAGRGEPDQPASAKRRLYGPKGGSRAGDSPASGSPGAHASASGGAAGDAFVIPLRPPSGVPVARAGRVRFAGLRTLTHSARTVACEVILRVGERDHTGTAEAPDTEGARLEAAARATFAALASAFGELPAALEGAVAVDGDRGRYALVLARGASDRDGVQLVGTASIDSAPEDAAVLATLQALDRWVTANVEAG